MSTLKQTMGFGDLLMFYVVTVFSLRWIATAAAAGPSAILIWIIAAFGLLAPLMFSVLELSSRYPEEGGVYMWSKHAFGDFAAFMTGWTYWASNLPYFPGLLYFTAGSALFIGGEQWQGLADNPAYFITFSLAGLAVAVVPNVVGLNVGKWLHNTGGVASWVPAFAVVIFGGIAWARFGSATEFTASSLMPSTHLKDIVFWSAIAFAFGGLESASLMGEEIHDARRNVPRAVVTAGLLITVAYLVSTISLLVALPREQLTGLQGIMQAIDSVGRRLGWTAIGPLVALTIVVSNIGAIGAWFAATARLPFVAGLDRFVPAAFGRLHPRWGTPYVSILVQAGVSIVFIFLGQAGTTVQGAYEVLVSMGVITYFIPFLFLFASMIRVQRQPAPPGAIRVPGGRPAAILLAALGFLTTAVSIVLAVIPSPDDPNPVLAIVKVVGLSVAVVGGGAAVYGVGRKRLRA